jgi:hypothetical protein
MSGYATIEKWAVLGNETAVCLNGLIYGHPDHPDGKQLTTPPIISRRFDEDGVGILYIAKNRAVFRLGAPNEDYEADFPESLARIAQEIKDGVPVCLGAPVAPAPAVVPEVIIEERPAPRTATEAKAVAAKLDAGIPLAPGTPMPALIRSTDRLPDVALFWWRPVQQNEKTDVERDTEDFERAWAQELREVEGMEDTSKELFKRLYLSGAAAARARK